MTREISWIDFGGVGRGCTTGKPVPWSLNTHLFSSETNVKLCSHTELSLLNSAGWDRVFCCKVTGLSLYVEPQR